MKNLLAGLLLGVAITTSIGSWGGGVDVGNARPADGRFEVPTFGTEVDLVNFVQNLLPGIEKGDNKEVKELIKRGNCSMTEINFGELIVHPSYRYNKNTGKLEKEFSGEVSVELLGCKRPNRL